MSPRAYNLGKRKASAEETRARIIDASRRILDSPDGVTAFTIDAVAREADVARMTVYYQFGSKMGLLDAIYDDLAARALVPNLPFSMQISDPVAQLRAVVNTFSTFWATDRLIVRRLRGLASTDPEIGEGISKRDMWRRGIFTSLVERVAGNNAGPETKADLVEMVLVATAFETFDKLADARGEEDAAELTLRLVAAALLQAGIVIDVAGE
jgi:AcrR family transcriptional regulator